MTAPRALFIAALVTAALPTSAFAVHKGTAPSRTNTVLQLTLVHANQSRSVTLTCQPHGGTHPEAAAACADLQQAQGNFAKLPGARNKACTMEYNPVDAKATGTWRGTPVQFTRNFGNPCTLNAETGPVFRF